MSANIVMNCYHITSQFAFSRQGKILDPLLVKQYCRLLFLLKSLVLYTLLDVGGQLCQLHYRISLVPQAVVQTPACSSVPGTSSSCGEDPTMQQVINDLDMNSLSKTATLLVYRDTLPGSSAPISSSVPAFSQQNGKAGL